MSIEERQPFGSGAPDSQAETACDLCGRFGAFVVAGRRLCADCYVNSGSCCPEFGAFDAATRAVESAEGSPESTHPESHAASGGDASSSR